METLEVGNRSIGTAPGGRGAGLALGVLVGLAGLKVVLHLAAIRQYGYFRDELYYLASTEHLAFGYVDHPPFSIALLALQRALLGDSLLALRLVPVLVGAGMVVLTGLLACRLGGGRFAQALAALTVLASPVYMGTHHTYSMNTFDQFLWTLAAVVLIGALTGGGGRNWLVLGLVIGLGLMNKISMIWFVAGLGACLVLTPHRRWLGTRWPWLALGVAALLFSPYLIWEKHHGFPTLVFMRNAAEQKMVRIGFIDFIRNQLMDMNPASAVVWVTGLGVCLFTRTWRPWRILAVIYLTTAAILVASGTSRASHLAVAYPMLLAPGAVALEQFTGRRRWIRPVIAAPIAVLGVLALPFAIPVLPVPRFVAYAAALGFSPQAEEHLDLGELPQHYADMHGWPEMAQKVARAYQRLSPDEQARCAIFGQNYGEAGAIDVLGRRYGLPPAISGHNSYWIWGPGDREANVVIIIGGDYQDNLEFFDSVAVVDTVECRHCMPYERNLSISIGRGLKAPLNRIWPRLRMFI